MAPACTRGNEALISVTSSSAAANGGRRRAAGEPCGYGWC
jgi:hypothetical protein